MDEISVTLVFTIINFISVIILGILGTYSHFRLQNHIDNRRVFVERIQPESHVIKVQDQSTETEQCHKNVTFSPGAPACYPPLPPASNPYYEIPVEEGKLPETIYSVLAEAQEAAERIDIEVQEEAKEVQEEAKEVPEEHIGEEEENLLSTEPVVKEDPERDRLLAVEATLAILLEQQAKLTSRLSKGRLPKK